MVRPTDQETTAIIKTVCYTHRSQKEVTHHTMGSTWRSIRFVRRQRERAETMGKRLYCSFYRRKWVRPGKQSYDWLT